jgi:hypothetical protein
MELRSKGWAAGLGLALVLASAGSLDAEQGIADQEYAGPVSVEQGARLVRVARKGKHAKPKPAASWEGQMELARQMVRTAYTLGRGLETRQRVALMIRLLYTMRPEVMAAEKREWAEEAFGLAQQLPEGEAADGEIATAAARVAVYDSERALELLDGLPSQGGQREDARTMAARLVFAVYMQHHGASSGVQAAQTLLTHGRRWGEHGGFPYGASAAVLGRLRTNEDAAEYFFREVLVTFERGQEGLFGVCEFAGLLERAAAMEAISEEAAEEAGRNIVGQLRKLAEGEDQTPWSDEQKRQVVTALYDVRVSAPKAYEEAEKSVPGLLALRVEKVAVKVEVPKVDAGLQAAFHELAEAMRERRTPEEMRAVIAQGLQLVNARYKGGACAACTGPDAQSWALVSLAANAAPTTIAAQLNAIEEPFWHAYFLAIAAQQVGEPTRVADPTRRAVEKEEAEPE